MNANENRFPADPRGPEELNEQLIGFLDSYWEALLRGEETNPELWLSGDANRNDDLRSSLELLDCLYEASEMLAKGIRSSPKLQTDATLAWSPKEGSRRLGRFELIDLVGTGSFGTVYRARDLELDRVVAIKVPRLGDLTTPDGLERFLREARSVAQLRHAGIVPIYEVGQAERIPFLVSEFVQGTTLADRSVRPAPPREAAHLVAIVAETLQYAHDRGVVHRDVKPSNIMIEEDGTPRLMDFGLAKREAGETTVTLDGEVLGTPAYMSPEQAAGEAHRVDGRSDVYSLGVVLYELLAGERPFYGTKPALIHHAVHEEPRAPRRVNQHVPRDLETITLKAMAKQCSGRYQTADELAVDLRRWLRGEPIHARPVHSLERLGRWCRRKPLVSGLSAATCLLLLSTLATTSIGYWRVSVAHRATEEQRDRAVQKEQEALGNLRQLLLYQARALRQSTEPGRRWAALDALKRAAAIQPGLDLRNEYLRCLELADLRPLRDVPVPDWLGGLGNFAAFRAAGNRILVVPQKGWPVEFDARTGERLREMDGMGAFASPAALSPDGRFFAGMMADGKGTQVWDLKFGKLLGELKDAEGRALIPKCLTFSDRSDRLAAAAKADAERGFTISIYDVASLRPLGTWECSAGFVDCLRFGPEGRLLAASVFDRSFHAIRLWNVRDCKQVAALKLDSGNPSRRYGDKPRRMDFSPDGQLLAAAGTAGTVKLWKLRKVLSDSWQRDASAQKETFSVASHAGEALIAQFSPNGQWLATAGQDRWLILWDTQSGLHAARVLLDTDTATNVQWSPSGSHILCDTAQGLRLWEYARPLARDYWLRNGPARPRSDQGGRVLSLQFSPQERWLACGWSYLQSQPLIDLQSPDAGCRYLEGDGEALTLAFSPVDEMLWAARRRSWQVWELAGLNRLEFKKGGNRRFLGLAFNGAGQRIAAGLEKEMELKVWNLDTEKVLLSLDMQHMYMPFQNGRITHGPSTPGRSILSHQKVQLSRDGGCLALLDQSEDRRFLKVFDLSAQAKMFTAPLSHPTPYIALADRARLVAVIQAKRILVYDPRTSRQTAALEGHDADVTDIALDRSGIRLASASSDGTVRLWNPVSGELLATFPAGQKKLTRIALSPTGRWLAAGSIDGQVRLWDLSEAHTYLKAAGLDWSGLSMMPRRN